MRHQYKLIINNEVQKGKKHEYSFGSTKGIRIRLCSERVAISFSQGVIRNPEDIISGNDKLCSDAIRKVSLLHLLYYAKPLKINRILFSADEETKELYNNKTHSEPILYSMITCPLDYSLSKYWQQESVINFIMNTTKTGYDGRLNALVALLIAKSKEYRSEKFLYLWMAMNGFYNYLSRESKNLPECKYDFRKEWRQHELMCAVISEKYKVGNLDDSEEDRLYREGISDLNKLTKTPGEFYDEISSMEDDGRFSGTLGGKTYQMSPLMFYSVWLPYKCRCKLFHANNAVPLFSFSEESTIKYLKYINCFVERFVETHLPEWMNEREITESGKDILRSACLRI